MATTTKKKDDEKRFVLPLILTGLAAIVIFHGLYWKEFTTLTADPLFIILDILGIAAFLVTAYLAWKHREGGAENTTRVINVVVAVAICVWVGQWCSQYRQDTKAGIEYKYRK